MTTAEIDGMLFRGFVACIFGFYALFTGWKCLHSPQRARPMYFKLAIEIARVCQGELAAAQKESELMNSGRIRRHGLLRILVGSLLVLSGSLQIIFVALL